MIVVVVQDIVLYRTRSSGDFDSVWLIVREGECLVPSICYVLRARSRQVRNIKQASSVW